MEEQQNTLKMKIDQKTVFILITALSLFWGFFVHFLVCLSKIISAFNINIRVFSLQSQKYLHRKTDKRGFTFSIGFRTPPPLPSFSDCFVLLHKTKIRTLKKDNNKWEKYTRAQVKDISIYSLAHEDSQGEEMGTDDKHPVAA